MTITDSRRTAAIVATHGSLFDHLVEAAGLRVVGVSSTAVLGEKLVSLTHPDVIVLENELPGEQGIDSLGYLRHASPGSEVILVVPDGLVDVDLARADTFAVLPKSRLADLAPLLEALDSRMDGRRVAARARTERRSGNDRREHQDWSKIGWDKRRSTDRRQSAVPR